MHSNMLFHAKFYNRLFIIPSVLILLLSDALAETYYVGTSAPPGTSSGNLFATIQGAVNAAQTPGQGEFNDIFIRGGVYQEAITINSKVRLRLQNYQDELVIVDGKDGNIINSNVVGDLPDGSIDNDIGLIDIVNSDDVQLSGFSVINSAHGGIRVVDGFQTIIDGIAVDVVGTSGTGNGSGITLSQNSNPAGSYSVIRNNTISNTRANGIFILNVSDGRVLVENNTVFNVEGNGNQDAIQVFDTPYVIIKNNLVYNASTVGDGIGDYIDVGGDQVNAPGSSNNIVIDGNKVFKGPLGKGSSGLKLNNLSSDVIIRNNLVHGLGLGLYEQPFERVRFYHNVLLDSSGHTLQFEHNPNPAIPMGNVAIVNNIFLGSESQMLLFNDSVSGLCIPQGDGLVLNGNLYQFSADGLLDPSDPNSFTQRGAAWFSTPNPNDPPSASNCISPIDYSGTEAGFTSWRSAANQEPDGGYTLQTLDELFQAPAPAVAPSVSQLTNGDYTLRDNSDAMGAGVDLTNATSASANNPTFVFVEDGSFFYDGFGLTTGDRIQIGDNDPVLVTNVSLLNNQPDRIDFQADDAISWPAGAGVNLVRGSGDPNDGPAMNSCMGTQPCLRVTEQNFERLSVDYAGSTPDGFIQIAPAGANVDDPVDVNVGASLVATGSASGQAGLDLKSLSDGLYQAQLSTSGNTVDALSAEFRIGCASTAVPCIFISDLSDSFVTAQYAGSTTDGFVSVYPVGGEENELIGDVGTGLVAPSGTGSNTGVTKIGTSQLSDGLYELRLSIDGFSVTSLSFPFRIGCPPNIQTPCVYMSAQTITTVSAGFTNASDDGNGFLGIYQTGGIIGEQIPGMPAPGSSTATINTASGSLSLSTASIASGALYEIRSSNDGFSTSAISFPFKIGCPGNNPCVFVTGLSGNTVNFLYANTTSNDFIGVYLEGGQIGEQDTGGAVAPTFQPGAVSSGSGSFTVNSGGPYELRFADEGFIISDISFPFTIP